MNEEESFQDLCQRYLNALDADVDEERCKELKEEIEELEEEREGYGEDYGEDDVLVEKVDKELEELRSELNETEAAVDQTENLEASILNRTISEFIAGGEYLSDECLEALNHIFTGKRDPELLIRDQVVDADSELEGNVRAISDSIRKIAMANLGTNDSIETTWENIKSGKKLEPFLIVAKAEEPLSPTQIAECLEEDVDSNTVGTRLRNAIHGFNYIPYHRIEGEYRLSTIGQFIFREYPGQEVINMPEQEVDEEEETEQSEQQVTLEAAGGEE